MARNVQKSLYIALQLIMQASHVCFKKNNYYEVLKTIFYVRKNAAIAQLQKKRVKVQEAHKFTK